jgi:Leucine-rich repeat (LRR) protein
MIEEADGGFTLFRWVNFGGEHYEIEKALSLNKTDRPAVDLMYRSAKSLRETPEQKAANDRMAAALSAFTKAGGRLQHQGLRIARIENEQPGPALDALKDMWIDYVEISSPDTTAKDIEKLANIPTMTRLWLSRSAITDEVFAPVGKLTKLRSIGFTRTVMTDDGLKSLAGLKELRKLNLSGDSTRATPASLSVLANLTNLEELSLSKWELTDASLQSISGLKKLKKLTFFGSNVNDAGLAHLKGMTALNELNLEESKVTNAGLAHLSGLTNLKQLTLRDTAITDAGLTHLKNLKSLEHLRLDGTKVTEKGIPDLYGLTNLKTLYFTKASKKALDELWEKIPKVTVYAD